jgi:uncharacterized membrane protein
MRMAQLILRILLGLAFVGIGITHFTDPPFYLKIMPDYIPQSLHAPAVYVSGVFEVLLGAMLIVPQTARLAGWGLIALLIAVFPANIYAYQHSEELFPNVDPALHFWRLPLQAVLVALVYGVALAGGQRAKTPPDEVSVASD